MSIYYILPPPPCRASLPDCILILMPPPAERQAPIKQYPTAAKLLYVCVSEGRGKNNIVVKQLR